MTHEYLMRHNVLGYIFPKFQLIISIRKASLATTIMSDRKPLILHAHATGPNPIKVAIALELLKLPYEVKSWEFGDDPKKGVKGETFLKINENGRVPALEDPNTGVVSWESGAILNYIRRQYDASGTKLGPRSADGGKPSAQDIVDFEKWEYFLLTTLGPMTGQTNWYRYISSRITAVSTRS